ncbi:MAG TPA: TlpA disulfide reductase family protein [Longimicrobiales bacterium]
MTPRSNTRPKTLWLRGLLVVLMGSLFVLAWTLRDRFSPVGVGSRVPVYSAQTLDGQSLSLQSLRGKVVVLNVWATWCKPCRTEMPALERLQQKFSANGLQVVAVSVDAPLGTLGGLGQPGGDVRAYVESLGLTFTVLHDPKRTIEQLFLVPGLPTTFVIDRNGRIDQKIVGAREWDSAYYIKYFTELLNS